MNNRYDDVTSSIFFIWPIQFFLIILLALALIFNLKDLAIFTLILLVSGLLAFLWCSVSLYNVECRLKPDCVKIFPDNQLKISLEINNSKLLPVILKFNFNIPASMAVNHSVQNQEINEESSYLWYQNSKTEIFLYPSKRGVYNLGPPTLRGSDFFGFYHKCRLAGDKIEFLVYPRAAKIRNIDIPKKEYFGNRTGNSPVSDPLYIKGTREYQPASAARNIHWKASARHCTLQEKVFESVEKEKVLVLLDVSGFNNNSSDANASAVSENENEQFETTLEVVTAFLLKLSHQGITAGFITNGHLNGKGSTVFPVSGNKDQLSAILETLARIKPAKNKNMTDILFNSSILASGLSCLYFSGLITQDILACDSFLESRRIPRRYFIPSEKETSINALTVRNTIYLENICIE